MQTESGASHARRSFIKLARASPDSISRSPNVEHRWGDGNGMVAATAMAHASRRGIACDHEAMTAGAPRCADDSLPVMPTPPLGRRTSACAESRWRSSARTVHEHNREDDVLLGAHLCCLRRWRRGVEGGGICMQ
jgi:hypothetical protein